MELLRKRELGIEAGGNKVFAEFLVGGELDGEEAEVARGVDIGLLVVDEERFSGQGSEFVERKTVDGWIGLGHFVFEAPDENVEAREPVEFALDTGQHCVAHVGEDGGADAVLLESELPGEHGRVLRGPHACVPGIEFIDGGGIEPELRIANEVLPELTACKLALIVGMAIGPVDGFKLVARQTRYAEHRVVRIRIRLSGENHSVVEDDRAQGQRNLLKQAACIVEGTPRISLVDRGRWTGNRD